MHIRYFATALVAAVTVSAQGGKTGGTGKYPAVSAARMHIISSCY
jgi:hypothetical protein